MLAVLATGALALQPSQRPPNVLQASNASAASSSTAVGSEIAPASHLSSNQRAPFTFNRSATVGNPWVGLVPFAPKTEKREVLANGSLSYSLVEEESACATCTLFPRSMENFYVPFASLMTGWKNFTLTRFDELLTQISGRGNQAICRIYIDYPGRTKKPSDGVPGFLINGLTFYSSVHGVTPDWSNKTLIDAIVQLVQHLGKTYDNDPRLAVFQVGLLGEWGEWHQANSHAAAPHEWYKIMLNDEEEWYKDHAADNEKLSSDYASLLTRPRPKANEVFNENRASSSASQYEEETQQAQQALRLVGGREEQEDGGLGAVLMGRGLSDEAGQLDAQEDLRALVPGSQPQDVLAHPLSREQAGFVARHLAAQPIALTDAYARFQAEDPEVQAAQAAQAVAAVANTPPAVPTAPVGSCWIFEPSGCPKGSGAGPDTAWQRDTWGEQQSAYQGADGCDLRRRHLNGWCGVTDVRTHYVAPAVPPAPPQPAPTSPPGSCWVLKPSGCPDGDHTPASTVWRPLSSWAQSQTMYRGSGGCKLRASHLNGWCGVTDVQTHYNPLELPPASPPPPFVLPTPPTSPQGSCWIIMPTGCPNGTQEGPQLVWTKDGWGMAQPQYSGMSGCALREQHLNGWCGVTTIRTHYVAFIGVPPSPPPLPSPSPPPTPKTGVPFATPDVQRRVLLAFNASFKHTALQVRYPNVLGGLLPTQIRVGFHDDSFDQDTYGARPNYWQGDYTAPEPWLFLPRMESSGALDRYKVVMMGGEVRPELQSCIFYDDDKLPKKCPWVGGREPLPFGACVKATNASFQWDHHMDTIGDDQLKNAYHDVGGMGYNFFLSELSAATVGTSFTITATIENRGVAPAYYPVSLTLNYPCGASGANSSFAGPLVSSLMPGESQKLITNPVAKVASADILASGAEACVLLTSPRALKPIKFAMNEQDEQGLVHVKL